MIRLANLFEIDAIWPHIAEGMKECCERSGGDITPDWLFLSCRKGEAILVTFEDGDRRIAGGLVASPQQWAGGRVLRILAITGRDMKGWLDDLLAYNPPLGIDKVIFEGRSGWARVPGVREVRRVFELDMSDGR